MQSGGKKYPREKKLLYTLHCCPLYRAAKLYAPKAVCLHHLKLHSTLEHHLSRAHSFLFFILCRCGNQSNSPPISEIAIPTAKFLTIFPLFCAV